MVDQMLEEEMDGEGEGEGENKKPARADDLGWG
jgi:hypothetical protein